MKKFLMAAVALFCLTMTCVTLTSCGDDNDSKVADKEYTMTSGIDWTNEGSLSEAEVIAIDVLGKSINATNVFADDADARRALGEVANRVASDIRGNGWIADGAVYTITLTLRNQNGNTVDTRKIVVNNGSVTVN
jgi:hypothetical protein